MAAQVETAKPGGRPGWYAASKRFEESDWGKAIWQLANTLLPYLALWGLAYWTVRQDMSFWVTLPILILMGLFLVRLFILFHDCGHGSFFPSQRANEIVGSILGVMVFTAYADWRHSHNRHHATAGDLDRRGEGDVWTMTVKEYQAASRWERLTYGFVRFPLTMLVFGPLVSFLIMHRFPSKGARKRERRSVLFTNLALVGILVVAHFTIGLPTYLLIKGVSFWVAGVLGIWLFYVQHQFEGVYWARHDAWVPFRAALEGASFYKLPKILQWFSGNIGFHHIHHVRARIPNYHLARCYREVPAFHEVTPVTLRSSLKSLSLNLWDEEGQRLVSFRTARALAR
ncbi:MAG: fatty acid desaturase [Anaerolineae bacterium]|nr:fatty acid desaturase [Anaerolineae bacterium]